MAGINEEFPMIKISVRNLVEFILRSGDIDNRVGALAKADASGGARPPEDRKEALLQEGGWICQRCGQVNPAYTGTCGCGAAKRDRGAPEAEAQREARELAHAQSLKAYKELLDAGALTQEEFDRKKAELLGL